MAPEPGRGRLIAIEAARGRDIERGAARLRTALKRKRREARAAISHWDASGTFYELRGAGRKALALTPRTLLLLYACDLAFRMRWEIEPALAAGQTVIAAPYVETAIAFGEAAGLPRRWLEEILRFAPRPDICLHVKDSKNGKRWARRPMDGFPEFASAAIALPKASRTGAPRCEAATASLQRLKAAKKCGHVSRTSIASLITALRPGTRAALAPGR